MLTSEFRRFTFIRKYAKKKLNPAFKLRLFDATKIFQNDLTIKLLISKQATCMLGYEKRTKDTSNSHLVYHDINYSKRTSRKVFDVKKKYINLSTINICYLCVKQKSNIFTLRRVYKKT